MPELSVEVLLFLISAAVCAGFIDAVVGGGGLIQLPALVIGLPAASPVQLLATNKLSSVCGTTVAATTFYRRVRPDPRTFIPLMLGAGAGAALGALVASLIPRSAFDPIVVVALILVGGWVLWKPDAGKVTVLRHGARKHLAIAVVTGLTVGFYDGALGPGTGSFFVFALVGMLGYDFLEASAKARLANWTTNVASLLVFLPQGAIMWQLGLMMGAGNLVGGYLGARTAVAKGSTFVRLVFLVIVTAFIVRIGGQVVGLW